MIILAIETSCDDTCAALVKAGRKNGLNFEILSNIVSSQTKIHKKYGGVWPFLAKREHQRNLPIVLKRALKKAGFEISLDRAKRGTPRSVAFPGPSKARNSPKACFPCAERSEELPGGLLSKKNPNPKCQMPKIDMIAVTVGPGLEPCLWVGVNFAKELAEKMKLPLMPVNHIEAHIFANLLPQIRSKSKRNKFLASESKSQKSKMPTVHTQQIKNKKIEFPTICLIVSGGHTQLILMKDFGRHPLATQYKILGETRDDAAGECFDKTARILGLGYPGGPSVAKMATKIKNHWTRSGLPEGLQSKIKNNLPRPMIHQKNYDFSFSGLKTAVLYNYKNQPEKIRRSKKYIQEMSFEIQQAVIDVLISKTLKAAKEFKAKSIILGGGVAANSELRRQFGKKINKELSNIQYLIPNIQFCTDNAAMVAAVGYYHWLKKKKRSLEEIRADANLRID